MSNPTFIRLSGWAFVIGAFFFYSSFFYIYMYGFTVILGIFLPLFLLTALGINGDNVGYLSFYASPILLTIGMFGLRVRYGEMIGKLGKTILLISPVGILFSFFTPALRGAGLFVLMTCLTLFGVLAVIKKPLPRWRNGLPIIAGIGYPTLFLASRFAGVTDEQFIFQSLLLNSMLAIQFTALMLLGFMLKRDVMDQSKPHLQEQPA